MLERPSSPTVCSSTCTVPIFSRELRTSKKSDDRCLKARHVGEQGGGLFRVSAPGQRALLIIGYHTARGYRNSENFDIPWTLGNAPEHDATFPSLLAPALRARVGVSVSE